MTPPNPTQPPPSLVLVASVLQQLVEDAALFQGSEVVDVLSDDGDVAAARPPAAVLVVGQRAQQRVVLVGGEVVPAGVEREESDHAYAADERRRPPPLDSLRLVPGGGVGQLHHVTRRLQVVQDVGWGGEAALAAVAAAVVDLPPDEVDQLHLLVEAETCRCGRAEVRSLSCPVLSCPRPSVHPSFPSLCVPRFSGSDVTKGSRVVVTEVSEPFVTTCFFVVVSFNVLIMLLSLDN